MEDLSIKYESINILNYEQAAQCLAFMFFNYEPVTSHLGMEWKSYLRMAARFCRVIGTEGLCFLAKDKNIGKVVGVITNVDMKINFGEKFANEEADDFSEIFEKLAPDIAMTGELEADYLEKMNFKPGECLHLFQCGVLPEYAGKNIATKLVEISLEAAVKAGYRYAVADCTSSNSRKILEKLNFTLENQIKYSDFVYENRKIFEMIEGSYYLMVKNI